MKHPLLLACAEALLSTLQTSLLPPALRFWAALWLARCSVVHYRCLLGNPSPTLHRRIRALQTTLESEWGCEERSRVERRSGWRAARRRRDGCWCAC